MRTIPFVLLALLLLTAPAAARDLSLLALPPVPDAPTEQSKVEEIQRKTAAGMNPFLKVLPWVAVMPVAVIGITLVDTAPLVAVEPTAPIGSASVMRSTGLTLAGVGLGLGITFDVLARTEHFFLGHRWHERLGLMIAGISLAAAGYGLASYGGDYAAHGGLIGFTIGGTVAFNTGIVLLIIDTFKFAIDDSKELKAEWRPGAVQFAAPWIAPTRNGAALGVGFRF